MESEWNEWKAKEKTQEERVCGRVGSSLWWILPRGRKSQTMPFFSVRERRKLEQKGFQRRSYQLRKRNMIRQIVPISLAR